MDKIRLFELYPEFHTVYGPYFREDGRQHIVLVGTDQYGCIFKRTISYPKLLAELGLNRRLNGNETVDHQDRNFKNNSFSNFVIRPLPEHARLDAIRVTRNEVACPICSVIFIPTKDQVRPGRVNTAGPFCSKLCSGTYGAFIQNGGKRIEKTPVVLSYYQLNKN